MNQWKRVEQWLEQHAPKLRCHLLGPVDEAVIDELEETVGLTLPSEVAWFYRNHNGLERGKLDGEWQVIAMEAMLVQWSVQKRMLDQGAFSHLTARSVGPVRPVWWNEKWIPFGYNGIGDLRCLDMDPPAEGRVGQVIVYWHNRPEREMLARSITDWLREFADDLEAGRYEVESELKLRRRQ